MTDRLVRTTPQQELGHPSNKALDALRSYVATEAYIRNLESKEAEGEGFGRLIKETRSQHLALLDKLTPAEIHFYNELKTLVDKNRDEDITEAEIQGLKRNGFSDAQLEDMQRSMKVLQKPT